MRLSELYTSVQGEGPNVGIPIQFVRFGGCNYRCPGWPCDTQYAIDPRYSGEWESVGVSELLVRTKSWPKHVCLTGGEPLTQRSSDLKNYVDMLTQEGYRIDLFTNGSQDLPNWASRFNTTIVMDWKLSGSGEGDKDLETRGNNRCLLAMKDAVKFVVADNGDLLEAQAWYNKWGGSPIHQVFVGAVWGQIPDHEIIKFITDNQLPWKLNVQVHKHIWAPDLRGV